MTQDSGFIMSSLVSNGLCVFTFNNSVSKPSKALNHISQQILIECLLCTRL